MQFTLKGFMQKFFYLTLLLAHSLYAQASAADVFVAVNKSNTTLINEQAVSKILKAEKLTWDDGKSVVLLIDSLEETDSQAFDEVTSMSKSQFMEYWRIKFFSGRALIPKQIKNQSNALTILSDNKNGIYISIGKEPGKALTDSLDLRIINLKY
jgi:UDP-N-acetyl-D-mannosaminuronic acid transferase (WecB/TagA/CpsF family)